METYLVKAVGGEEGVEPVVTEIQVVAIRAQTVVMQSILLGVHLI